MTRPFFGRMSDEIGCEDTMLVALAMEGCGIYMLHLRGHDRL